MHIICAKFNIEMDLHFKGNQWESDAVPPLWEGVICNKATEYIGKAHITLIFSQDTLALLKTNLTSIRDVLLNLFSYICLKRFFCCNSWCMFMSKTDCIKGEIVMHKRDNNLEIKCECEIWLE